MQLILNVGSSSTKENDIGYHTLKSEQFAVSLRKEKKKEIIGLKRMKNLTARCEQFYGHN